MVIILRLHQKDPGRITATSRPLRTAVSVTSPAPLRTRCSIIPVSLITVLRAMVLPRLGHRVTKFTNPLWMIALYAITPRPLLVPGSITRMLLVTVPHATMVQLPEEKYHRQTMCQQLRIAACATRPRALYQEPFLMMASWITVDPVITMRLLWVNQ